MALRSFRLLSPLTVFAAIGAAGWIAACGTSDSSKFGDNGLNDGDDAGFNTSSGFIPTGDGSSGNNGDGGPGSNDTLKVEPATLTVTAKGSLSSVTGTGAFKAFVNNGAEPVAAIWSVDDAGIGSIGKNDGAFKTAKYAGKTKVRARVGNLVATAEVSVVFEIEENPGDISEADRTKLQGKGTADAANFKWLYPYDKTVFPRGLLPPRLMFGGAKPDAYYIHLETKNVTYNGYFKAEGPQPRIRVSDAWWAMVTRSAGTDDPVKIEVTKIAGGQVTGPIPQTWTIAQGSLKGTVFYNTYNSLLVKAAEAEGAVMRLKPGKDVEVFLSKTALPSDAPSGQTNKCTVCHSVSANGTALAAGLNWGGSGTQGANGSPFASGVWDIGKDGAPKNRFVLPEGRAMPFGALSPDGNLLVGNASPYVRGLSGAYPSRVYNAKDGTIIEDNFFTAAAAKKAISPAFSPDGTRLAYGDRDADANGNRLSILNVNLGGSKPTFTDHAQLVANNKRTLGWPSFLPDSKAVLYQEGQSNSYDTGGWTDTTELIHYCADLSWVDTATKLPAALDALNGYGKDKNPYLPFANVADKDDVNPDQGTACNTQDLHMNYEPTVLPVAVGGFYWVVFTSRRAYGNFLWHGADSVTPTGDLPFDNTKSGGDIKGYRKKLWVAAIDINGQPGTDISHPAFLLEGQEIEAGNMRGFWALDPCKDEGAGCEGGDECCNGFCRAVDDGAGGTKNACVPPPTGCANDSEKCSVNADCCNAPTGTTCIGGFCTAPTPGGVK